MWSHSFFCDDFFFFNDTATTEIYTLSLHDALPIFRVAPNTKARASWPWPSGLAGSRRRAVARSVVVAVVAARGQRSAAGAAVDAVAELLAGAEEDAALGLDRNHLPRLGVAALVALVILDVERAQAADLDV